MTTRTIKRAFGCILEVIAVSLFLVQLAEVAINRENLLGITVGALTLICGLPFLLMCIGMSFIYAERAK